MKVNRLGEFGLIERLRRRVSNGTGVRIGIGDDAAWVANPRRSSLVTADMLIEGVHFNLDWTTCIDLGFKSLAVNLSDIAAMGGAPAYAVLSLGLPSGFDLRKVDDFYRGFQHLARSTGVSVIGGDLSAAKLLTIAVAVIGHPPRRPLRRSGAAVGDDIYVTGTLGDSALALRLLQTDSNKLETKAAGHLLSRHHRPSPRTTLGMLLGKSNLPTAMIDVSDGLLQDLEHISRASRVGAVIDREELPLSDSYRELAGKERDSYALRGGEDYELLFCARPRSTSEIEKLSRRVRIAITKIGKCTNGNRILIRDRSGRTITLRSGGHDHFRRRH